MGETTKLDFWTELAQSLRTADRVLAGIGPERAPEPIPLWHPVREDPPKPGWYLVIVRRDDGQYAGEGETWHGDRYGWGITTGTDPVVAWADDDGTPRAPTDPDAP